MKRGTIEHVKTARLAAALSLELWGAVGILESLWHATAKRRPLGILTGMSEEDIVFYIGWMGDAHQLVQALIDTRWLDRLESGELQVHDWQEHCDDATKKYQARLRQKGPDKSSQNPPVSGHVRTSPDISGHVAPAVKPLSRLAVKPLLTYAASPQIESNQQAKSEKPKGPTYDRERGAFGLQQLSRECPHILPAKILSDQKAMAEKPYAPLLSIAKVMCEPDSPDGAIFGEALIIEKDYGRFGDTLSDGTPLVTIYVNKMRPILKKWRAQKQAVDRSTVDLNPILDELLAKGGTK